MYTYVHHDVYHRCCMPSAMYTYAYHHLKSFYQCMSHNPAPGRVVIIIQTRVTQEAIKPAGYCGIVHQISNTPHQSVKFLPCCLPKNIYSALLYVVLVVQGSGYAVYFTLCNLNARATTVSVKYNIMSLKDRSSNFLT